MIPFIGRRILFDVLVLVGVLFLVDVLVYLSGDPVRALVPPSAGPEVIERVRVLYGFDQPLPAQFVRFLARAVQGDFGTSVRFGTPALGVVLERVPLTLLLGLTGVLIGLAIALPLGLLAARRRGTWVDLTARGVAVVGQGVPNFVMGPVLVLLFAVSLGWLPVSGRRRRRRSSCRRLVVGLGTAAGLTRILRSALLEELGRDYIRTARAKGVPDRAVVRRHALRNAAIPVVTFLAFYIAALLSGIVVPVERVFQPRGMGLLAIRGDHEPRHPGDPGCSCSWRRSC